MKNAAALLVILLGLLFVGGLLHLFNLRFEAGDVYPPYSTLRSDPLGARALHDSLAELTQVERNFRPLERLDDGRGTALLHLGSGAGELAFTTNQFQVFERFLRTGGRLVFALQPEFAAPRTNRFGAGRSTMAGRGSSGTNGPPARRAGLGPRVREAEVSVEERWEVAFKHETLARGASGSGAYEPARARRLGDPRPGESALPRELAIHSARYFEPANPAWRTVYQRVDGTNEWPVVLERAFGKGSLVLVADAYPFSNEALRRDRQPALLTWTVGGRARVVFDETHLGTAGDPGIAAMARRYHLHALAAALVILALLFIWQSAATFLPSSDEDQGAENSHQVAGRDSTEGFVNLLRRHIAPADILKTCLEQWKLTVASTSGRKPPRARLEDMQQLIDEQNALEPRRRQPVATYRRFCEILAKRT